MRQLTLFVCLIFIALLASAQENNMNQAPPIKTTDNYRVQTASSTQITIPNRTVDNVKMQTINMAQTVAIRTTDNVKTQPVNTVQTLAIKTEDKVQQAKTAQTAQTVPLRKTDAVGTIQASNAVKSNALDKASASSTSPKVQPPSSISSKQAQEEIQKSAGGTVQKKMD